MKIIENFVNGLSIGLGIFIVLVLGLFLVRADFSGLEAQGNNSVLTQNKWNELVNSLSGIKFKIIDGNFTNADENSYPHGIGDMYKILDVSCSAINSTGIFLRFGFNSTSGANRLLFFDDTNIIIRHKDWPTSNAPFKCVLLYKN